MTLRRRGRAILYCHRYRRIFRLQGSIHEQQQTLTEKFKTKINSFWMPAVGCEQTRTVMWLGRQDSNLGMAESKSDQFPFLVKTHSEKTAKFSPDGINRLDRVSERRTDRAAAKTRLWLTGWTKPIAGGRFVSLLVEIADERGRPSSSIERRHAEWTVGWLFDLTDLIQGRRQKR
jgi:hypothetical protein